MLLHRTCLRRILALPGLICAFAIHSNGLCGDPPAAPAAAPTPPPPFWDASFHAGFGLTDGNSDTLNAAAGFRATHQGSLYEIFLGTDFTYSEDSNVTTGESVYSFAQVNRMLTDRLYFGVFNDFLYDGIAAVDYRVTTGPTLGYYVIRNERTNLAFEVGAGYLWEDVGGVADDFWTVRFAQRFDHQLTETLTLFESVSFLPAGDDWNNYLINAEAGIESRLSDRLSLRLFAQNRYDSRPAAGLERNDFGIYTGFSFSLGPVEPIPPTPSGKGVAGSPGMPGSDWEVDFAVGFSATDGNSDTIGVSADLLAVKLTEFDEVYFGIGGAYGETAGAVNQERAYGFAQYNKIVASPFYLGGRADFLYDAVSALDYRVSPSVLAGVNLIATDTTRLAVEVGPSYTWEEQAGVASDYYGVYVGQRFSTQISERIDFWQTAGAVLDIDNTDNIVVDAAAGFDLKIGDRLSLRTAVRNIYDGVPAAGLEKNDFQVVSGLVWAF